MEYITKTITRVIMLILAVLSISSCGFFEPDNDFKEIEIKGNVIVLNTTGLNTFDLTFVEPQEIYATIVEDCKAIYFDQENDIILVSKNLTKEKQLFYKVEILDESAKYISDAVMKNELSKSEFLSRKVGAKRIK